MKPKPLPPSVDAQDRTLFKVEVEVREVHRYYFWADSEQLAEKATDFADGDMADDIHFDDPETSALPINEKILPVGAKTYVVSWDDEGNRADDIRPTADVREEELENATEEERRRLEQFYAVKDTLTLEMFPEDV